MTMRDILMDLHFLNPGRSRLITNDPQATCTDIICFI
jgi:hypothetical protein